MFLLSGGLCKVSLFEYTPMFDPASPSRLDPNVPRKADTRTNDLECVSPRKAAVSGVVSADL